MQGQFICDGERSKADATKKTYLVEPPPPTSEAPRAHLGRAHAFRPGRRYDARVVAPSRAHRAHEQQDSREVVVPTSPLVNPDPSIEQQGGGRSRKEGKVGNDQGKQKEKSTHR